VRRLRYTRKPRPARIAAPPRPNSVPSCSPAVPPPPVCGAPLGMGVADGVAECVGSAVWVGVAEGVADRETVTEGDGEALLDTRGTADDLEGEALADGLAELPVGLAEAGEVVALREADGLADPVGPAPLPDVFSLLDAPPVCGEGEPAPDAVAVAVPLYRPEDAVPEEGEKIAGIEEDAPEVQADTDTDSRTVTVAQPAAVSRALLTFMKPPYIPGTQQP
jgi:hypothetical protein